MGQVISLIKDTQLNKFYRILYWFGYFSVLFTSLIPILGHLDKVKLGYGVFTVRLDHLLHFSVYFLICMYYLAGQWKKLSLFDTRPLQKFILATVLLALVSEIVQLWVPARAFNAMDIAANVAGIFVGVVLIKTLESGTKTPNTIS
jgi:glycopeptide antibiotics resistance protein